MGFPSSSCLWSAASCPRRADVFLTRSRACGFSVTALDASLSGHAKGAYPGAADFSVLISCPTNPEGGQLSPVSSAKLLSQWWICSSSPNKGHCFCDSRSRKLVRTSTRSQNTWKRLRNSTVSSCLHRFLSQVSVSLELSHPATALGTGTEPSSSREQQGLCAPPHTVDTLGALRSPFPA